MVGHEISITFFKNGNVPLVKLGTNGIYPHNFSQFSENGYFILYQFYYEIGKHLKVINPTLKWNVVWPLSFNKFVIVYINNYLDKALIKTKTKKCCVNATGKEERKLLPNVSNE